MSELIQPAYKLVTRCGNSELYNTQYRIEHSIKGCVHVGEIQNIDQMSDDHAAMKAIFLTAEAVDASFQDVLGRYDILIQIDEVIHSDVPGTHATVWARKKQNGS